MKDVELYAKVRHAVRIQGLSKRAVARRFGIDPRTVNKMLEFSVPAGAETAMARMRTLMTRLGSEVNETKTRVARLPEDDFTFLGYTIGRFYGKDGRQSRASFWEHHVRALAAALPRVSDLLYHRLNARVSNLPAKVDLRRGGCTASRPDPRKLTRIKRNENSEDSINNGGS